MSSPTDSGDLDEPADAEKVENVKDQDPTVTPQKAKAIDSVDICAVEDSGEAIRQDERLPDEVLMVDQQSTLVDKQAFDQTGVTDVDDSRSSQLEDKSNECELERDMPIKDTGDQQLSEEVADQSLNQNVGDNDSRRTNCEEKSNDLELERDIPMESEDNCSSELYDFPISILVTMLLSEAKIGVLYT